MCARSRGVRPTFRSAVERRPIGMAAGSVQFGRQFVGRPRRFPALQHHRALRRMAARLQRVQQVEGAGGQQGQRGGIDMQCLPAADFVGQSPIFGNTPPISPPRAAPSPSEPPSVAKSIPMPISAPAAAPVPVRMPYSFSKSPSNGSWLNALNASRLRYLSRCNKNGKAQANAIAAGVRPV